VIVECHDSFGNPVQLHANKVVLKLSNGTPIAIVVEEHPNHVTHSRVTDPDFDRELRRNGVHQTVILTQLQPH
jgi:hypothetical protein